MALCIDEVARAGAESRLRPGVVLCPRQGCLADGPEAGLHELIGVVRERAFAEP